MSSVHLTPVGSSQGQQNGTNERNFVKPPVELFQTRSCYLDLPQSPQQFVKCQGIKIEIPNTHVT